MKTMIHGFVSALIAFAFLLAVTTVMGHMTRTKESSTSLSAMLNQAVDSVMQKEHYSININTQDKFVTDVLVALVGSYSNDAELSIDVVAADYEKGVLCIRLSETYTDPNGGTSVTVADKTVVFEQDEAITTYKIIYVYDDKIHTSFNVDKGKTTTIVENPSADKVWKDAEGKIYNPGEMIYLNDNLILYAE